MKWKICVIISSLMTVVSSSVWACEVCQSQQPKVLQNITHGAGPQGQTDFIIIAVAIVIVLVTLFLSIKYLWKPGEQSSDHIKRIVLDNY
jgi:hypothetical protein